MIRRRRPLMVPATVLALALASGAAAQDGPRQLFPGALPPTPSVETPSAPEIATQPLAPPGPGEISGLPSDDPIGAESWQGVEPAVVEQLLRDMPAPDAFTAPLRLQARLLLAPGTAALGGADFLATRVRGLLALGYAHDAPALIGRVPSPAMTPALREAAVEAPLMAGDVEAGCDAARGLDGPSAFATEARIACALLQGHPEQAGIMLGATRDTGTELDPELAAVAQALSDGTTAPLPKDEGSPLVRALLGMAEVTVTPAGLAAASPEIQAALAFNTTLPAETRIAAAEAAATGGGLSIEALRKVYLEAGKASGDTPAGLRAALYRALAAAHEPMDQEARLLAAWRAPAGGPLRVVWGRALGEAADALTPDPTVAAAAEAAIPALLLDGRLQKAQRWARVLALPRARDEAVIEGRLGEGRLGILLALAGGDAATSGAAGGSGLDRAIRDGMGLPVAGPSWLALAAQRPSGGQEGPAPGLGAWRALATAADGRRAGQAALAALLLLGRETRPPPPLVADGVLRGLRDAGLGHEAATLAAGWAVAAGAGGGR